MGSKTLHQQNSPVLNWRCRLTQVDLCNGRETMVVVVVVEFIDSIYPVNLSDKSVTYINITRMQQVLHNFWYSDQDCLHTDP